MEKTGKDQIYLVAQQLQDADIRETTLQMLGNAPDYFWTAPASSTGKYHPAFAQGEGGLVRHTLAAVTVAISLFQAKALYDFNSLEKDIIIAALLLHDTCKYGYPEKQEYTVFEHPMLVSCLYDKANIQTEEGTKIADLMVAIYSHMGCWNINRDGRMMMPEPKNEVCKFVHLCDYLASQKFMTDGQVPEIVVFVDDVQVQKVACDSPVNTTVAYTNSDYWDEEDWQGAVDINNGPVRLSRKPACVDRELVVKYRNAQKSEVNQVKNNTVGQGIVICAGELPW